MIYVIEVCIICNYVIYEVVKESMGKDLEGDSQGNWIRLGVINCFKVFDGFLLDLVIVDVDMSFEVCILFNVIVIVVFNFNVFLLCIEVISDVEG